MICQNRKTFYYDVSRSLAFGLCLVLVRQPLDASADRHCGFDNNQPNRGICGRHLAHLVSTVCKPLGGVNKRDVEVISDLQTLLNDNELTSKSLSSSDYDEDSNNEINDVDESSPSSTGLSFSKAIAYSRSRRTAESMPDADAFRQQRRSITSHTIERRGIVCECCVHRCSLSELKLYCRYPHAPPPQPSPRESPRLTASAAAAGGSSTSSSSSAGPDERYRVVSRHFRR